MARNIVPPPDRPDEQQGLPPTAVPESVHPAYDAALDPETQVFHAYTGTPARPGSGPVDRRSRPALPGLFPRPRPRRGRSRMMLAALGGGAGAFVIIAATGAVLSTTDPGGGATEGTAPPASGVGPYTLEALSQRGHAVTVTFTDPDGSTAESDVPSGWTTDVPAGVARRPVFTVSTEAGDAPAQRNDTITCRVRQNGVVVQQNTVTGKAASADCTGY